MLIFPAKHATRGKVIYQNIYRRKKNKKILALLLVAAILLTLAACGGSGETAGENCETTYKVAMITDYADITDQSFNQTTWEACVKFGEQTGIDVRYYKPMSNDTSAEPTVNNITVEWLGNLK